MVSMHMEAGMILSPDQYRLRYRVKPQDRVAAPDLEELKLCDFAIDWEELYSCGGLDFGDYEDETAHIMLNDIIRFDFQVYH